MLKLVFLFVFLVTTCFADSMVFMEENDNGKHIILSKDGKFTQITSGEAWHLYPDITTDGKEIAYIKVLNDSFFIEMYNTEAKSFERWYFDHIDQIFHLNFSHNNEHLLMSAGHNGKQKFASLEFKEARKLFAPKILVENGNKIKEYTINHPKFYLNDYDVFFPKASADMSFFVYQQNINQTREVILWDRISDKKIVVGDGMAPALSFDERFIAYTNKHNEEWDIVVYDRFQKSALKLDYPASRDFAPTFDRDNNIVFASDKMGEFSLYVVRYQDWVKGKAVVTPYAGKIGSSFYAAQFGGNESYQLSRLADFPKPARSSFGAIYHQGRVYISGGHQGPEHTYPEWSFTNTFQYYDIKTGKWVEAAKRHFKCHGYGLIAHENYIYAFGGFAYSKDHTPKWKSLNVVERYNILEDKWEIIGAMPRNRSSNTVTKVGNKVYLIGGWDSTPKFDNDLDGTFHSEIDVFDLTSETFTTLETKLDLKRRALSSVEFNNKIYLIGGISEGASHFSLLDNVTEFDPQTESFIEKEPLPFATFAPAAGVLNQKLYVFGGMFKTGQYSYEYVPHVFESNFNAWRHSGRYLLESKGFSQVVNIENQELMVLGGHRYYSDRDEPVQTVELFKIK